MKKVALIIPDDVFPVEAGHHKAIVDICKYLHRQGGFKLKIVQFSMWNKATAGRYLDICDEYKRIQMPRRWGFVDLLNKVFLRITPLFLGSFVKACAMRKSIMREVADCEEIVLFFTGWFPLLKKRIRMERVCAVTVDIIFHRVSSIRGDTPWGRFCAWANRFFEIRVLKSFRKVCVLGDYEETLLRRCGVPEGQIIRIGMPIEVPERKCVDASTSRKYDFLMLGSATPQNVDGVKTFFSRVAPLLNGRGVSFAVAGKLSYDKIFDSDIVPHNVKVIKLGYVDDLSSCCADALVGVATVPYGSGIKVKVVELMMNGLPMILTNSGAEGIPMTQDGSINIDVEDEDVVATRMISWLDNPSTAISAGKEQGQRLRTAFSPETMLQPLKDFLSK